MKKLLRNLLAISLMTISVNQTMLAGKGSIDLPDVSIDRETRKDINSWMSTVTEWVVWLRDLAVTGKEVAAKAGEDGKIIGKDFEKGLTQGRFGLEAGERGTKNLLEATSTLSTTIEHTLPTADRAINTANKSLDVAQDLMNQRIPKTLSRIEKIVPQIGVMAISSAIAIGGVYLTYKGISDLLTDDQSLVNNQSKDASWGSYFYNKRYALGKIGLGTMGTMLGTFAAINSAAITKKLTFR